MEVGYILAALAFSLILMYVGVVKAERDSYKRELEKLKFYMEQNGYPVGYNINGLKVVRDTHMNCKGCVFHSIIDGKEKCNKRPEYGPCYSSARSDKQSIKFYSDEEERDQA